MNWYAFVGGDPIGGTDSTGTSMDEYGLQALGKNIESPPRYATPLEAARAYNGSFGWTPWGIESSLRNPSFTGCAKCNIFVGDMHTMAGMDVRIAPPGGEMRLPTAAEWAARAYSSGFKRQGFEPIIPGYGLPHSFPQPGDVVSNGAHCGIQDTMGVWQASTNPKRSFVFNISASEYKFPDARTPLVYPSLYPSDYWEWKFAKLSPTVLDMATTNPVTGMGLSTNQPWNLSQERPYYRLYGYK